MKLLCQAYAEQSTKNGRSKVGHSMRTSICAVDKPIVPSVYVPVNIKFQGRKLGESKRGRRRNALSDCRRQEDPGGPTVLHPPAAELRGRLLGRQSDHRRTFSLAGGGWRPLVAISRFAELSAGHGRSTGCCRACSAGSSLPFLLPLP